LSPLREVTLLIVAIRLIAAADWLHCNHPIGLQRSTVTGPNVSG